MVACCEPDNRNPALARNKLSPMRTLLVLLAASRADETCLPCDYDNLRVPRSVAFRLPDAKFYVDHTDGKDASFDAIFRYWDDVRAANGTTPETACNTPLAAPNAVAALAKVARRGARKGALVAFVGDSFMRIAWQRLVQAGVGINQGVTATYLRNLAILHAIEHTQ